MNMAIGRLLSEFRKLVYKNRGCVFGWMSYIDRKTVLGNNVSVGRGSKLINCNVGIGTDIDNGSRFDNCKIGKYCAIGDDCYNIIGHHPTSRYVALNSKFYKPRKGGYTDKRLYTDEYKYADKSKEYNNIIGNDVYITNNVIILEGVNIGDGVVITPGSVVTKNIPPYAIVRGNPAQIVTYRFSEQDIKFLMELKWWDKDEQWIRSHIELFSDVRKMKEYCKNECGI